MKLTITTLVIVEGSYIQGIFHIHVDDAIYEVLTMPREKITI